MSLIERAQAIRARLMNPPNAVPDTGINLRPKRDPAPFYVPPSAQVVEAPKIDELPVWKAKPAPRLVREFKRKRRKRRPTAEELAERRWPGLLPQMRIIAIVVSEHFNVTRAEIYGDYRERRLVIPRHLMFYFTQRLCGTKSLLDIARRFGNRDHTTVLHGIRRTRREMARDPIFAATVEELEATILGRMGRE